MSTKIRRASRGRSVLGRLNVRHACFWVVLLLGTLPNGPAAAESLFSGPGAQELSASQSEARDPTRFLPGAIAAASGSAQAAGLGWAGYDGATHDPMLGAAAEARLGSRLVIGVGVTYAASTSLQPWAVRPSVAARLQLLDQQTHGIDAGVAVGFRQDRFVEEEGLIQVSVAGGWRSERTTLLANLGYGQDGEADDHEGEVRLAGLRRLHRGLYLGLDGHFRKLLTSTDPFLDLHGTPSLEFTAGPVAALTAGSWVLTIETGVSGVRRGVLQTGAVVVSGVGATY
jgi:hypothetical protein